MVRTRARLKLFAAVIVALAGCAAPGMAQPRTSNAGNTVAPVTIKELAEIAGLSGLMVSPDGERAILRVEWQDVDTNRTLLEWRIVNLRDGAILASLDAGQPRWGVNGNLAMETPQWAPDSLGVYFLRLDDQQVQLYRADLTGKVEKITRDASDVVAFIVESDGTVHYAVGPGTRDAIMAAEQIEYDGGVLLDSRFIAGFRITHNFPINGRMATYRHSPGAKKFGRATLLGELPLRVTTLTGPDIVAQPALDASSKLFDKPWEESLGGMLGFDPAAAQRTMFAPLSKSAHLEPVSDGPETSLDPRSGYLLSWKTAGQGGTCHDQSCVEADELMIVGWANGGRDLIFQTWTMGSARLMRWNTETGNVHAVLEIEGVLGGTDGGKFGACQLSKSEVICIASGPDLPPKLIGVDLATGRTRDLLDPNPHVSRARLGVAHKIELIDRWGSLTLAYVVLPRDVKLGVRLPLVLTSYSCRGFLLGGSGQDVPEHVLAGLGFATACVDQGYSTIRLADGFKFSPETTNLSGLDFFEATVDRLNADGIVDPRRVLLTGFSGSATNTAMAITRSRTFTAAAVTTGGSLDANACYLAAHYRSCAEWAQEEGYGLPYDSRTGVLANSPAWNVDKISAPLLMQLPETEYSQMMQLYGAMVDYGRAVEMVIFPDAYHYKNQPRQRLAVYDRNVDWAEFWLRGRVSHDHNDAEQNARWLGMRTEQCEVLAGELKTEDLPWYCDPQTGH